MTINMKPSEKIEQCLGVIQETIKLKPPIGNIVIIPEHKFTKRGLSLYDTDLILLGLLRKKEITDFKRFYGWIMPSGGVIVNGEMASTSDNDYVIFEMKIDEKKISHLLGNSIPDIYYKIKGKIFVIEIQKEVTKEWTEKIIERYGDINLTIVELDNISDDINKMREQLETFV